MQTHFVRDDFDHKELLGLAEFASQHWNTKMKAGGRGTYVGTIVDSRRTLAGQWLTELCRLIGTPLPLDADVGVPAVVTVTEDGASGGQFWTRMYGRLRGFPQVVHSSKRFAGPTGLEEYLGCDFGIALTVSTDEQALQFHSDHYFPIVGDMRLRLPRWLSAGALTISHVEQGDERFAFVLSLVHPLFGEIIRQTGIFRERPADAACGVVRPAAPPSPAPAASSPAG